MSLSSASLTSQLSYIEASHYERLLLKVFNFDNQLLSEKPKTKGLHEYTAAEN